MRWALCAGRNSPFTCCFCCHVRTGTLVIGSFSLVLNIFSIVATLFLIFNPSTVNHYEEPSVPGSVDNSIYVGDDADVSTVSTVDTTNSSTWSISTSFTHASAEHRVVELILNLGATVFTVGLLYGILKRKGKFLLPYFCLQVFDFCLNALVIIGFFTYEQNIKKFLASTKDFPLKEQLMRLNNGWLVFIAGTVAVICLWIKAYCINIVWACYKYLMQDGSSLPHQNDSLSPDDGAFFRNGLAIGIPYDEASSAVSVGIDNQVLLMPPKYEDVLTMPEPAVSTAQPPPAYNEVVHHEPNTSNS